MKTLNEILHGKYFKRVALVFAVLMTILPIFVATDLQALKNAGYLGFLAANYFGFGVFVLPFLIETHNILLLVLIGGFGNTIDEFFAWFAGRMTEEFETKKKLHERVEKFVLKRGLGGIFIMGVLPLPGILYDIAAFVMGHYKVSYFKFFFASFLGKLLRWTVLVFIVKNFLVSQF